NKLFKARVEANRLLAVSLRPGRVAFLLMCHRAVEVRAAEALIQTNGLGKVSNGAVVHLLAAIRQAAVVERNGEVRLHLDGAVEVGKGPVMVVLFEIGQSAVVVPNSRLRIQL